MTREKSWCALQAHDSRPMAHDMIFIPTDSNCSNQRPQVTNHWSLIIKSNQWQLWCRLPVCVWGAGSRVQVQDMNVTTSTSTHIWIWIWSFFLNLKNVRDSVSMCSLPFAIVYLDPYLYLACCSGWLALCHGPWRILMTHTTHLRRQATGLDQLSLFMWLLTAVVAV